MRYPLFLLFLGINLIYGQVYLLNRPHDFYSVGCFDNRGLALVYQKTKPQTLPTPNSQPLETKKEPIKIPAPYKLWENRIENNYIFVQDSNSGLFTLLDKDLKEVLPYQFNTADFKSYAQQYVVATQKKDSSQKWHPQDTIPLIIYHNGITKAACEAAPYTHYNKSYYLIRLKDKNVIYQDTHKIQDVVQLCGNLIGVCLRNATLKEYWKILDSTGKWIDERKYTDLKAVNNDVYKTDNYYVSLAGKRRKASWNETAYPNYIYNMPVFKPNAFVSQNYAYQFHIDVSPKRNFREHFLAWKITYHYIDGNLKRYHKYVDFSDKMVDRTFRLCPNVLPVNGANGRLKGIYILSGTHKKKYFACDKILRNTIKGVIVQKGKKYKHLTYAGEDITPIYDDIELYPKYLLYVSENSYFLTHLKGKKSYYNANFEPIEAEPSNEALLKVGLADTNANVIIPIVYDQIESVQDSLFICKSNKLGCSLKNAQGKDLLPQNNYLYLSEYKGFFSVTYNGKESLYSGDFKEIIPFKYDNISIISSDYFFVEHEKKSGVIDRKGNIILPFRYTYCRDYDHFFTLYKNGKYNCFRYDGKPFMRPFQQVYEVKENLLHVKYHNRFGVIDTHNRWIIPPHFKDDLVQTPINQPISILTYEDSKGKLRYIAFNRKGKKLSSLKRSDMEKGNPLYLLNQAFLLVQNGNTLFLKDSLGRVLWRKKGFCNGTEKDILWFAGKDGIALWDKNGKALTANYDYISDLHSNLRVVTKQQKYGLIDQTGKEFLAPKYDKIDIDTTLGIITLVENEKKTFCNLNGEKLITPQYDYASDFSKGLCVIGLRKKIACINTAGKMLLPFEYEGIEILDSNLVATNQSCLWTLRDTNGNIIDSRTFESVSWGRFSFHKKEYFPFYSQQKMYLIPIIAHKPLRKDSCLIFWENEKMGIITQQGKILHTAMYDEISIVEPENYYRNNKNTQNTPNIFIAKQGNLYGILDDKGVLSPCEYQQIKANFIFDEAGNSRIWFNVKKDEKYYYYFYNQQKWHLKERQITLK